MESLLPRRQSSRKVWVFLAIAVCFFSKLFFAGGTFVFSHSLFVVTSSSMHPEFPIYTAVVVRQDDFSQVKVGDVIVFKADALGGGLAFHRVVRKDDSGVYTKGDNNAVEDGQLVTEANYLGRCVLKIAHVAHYLQLISTWKGLVVFFIMPSITIVLAVVLVKEITIAKR